MLDYKGMLSDLTGFAKENITGVFRRGGRNSTNTSVTSSGTNSSASTSRAGGRGRDRARNRQCVRLTSEEARTSPIVAREAREDGIYTAENGVGSPFVVVSSWPKVVDKRNKNGEGSSQTKTKPVEIPKKKKKNSRALNIPTRDMFAPDFVIQPDEDLPGFSPIDSEWDSEDEAFEEHLAILRDYPEYTAPQPPMPPPLMGLNPDIPNEYDPVIGIISIQGVRIPRSQPIDIVPPREPTFPFFGGNTDLHVMLIAERMYDVFKERMRKFGKQQMLVIMENMAMSSTCGYMCGRLVPVVMMDETTFYFDYETVSFVTKPELINLLGLCEPDDFENNSVAQSVPDKFHKESPEEQLERNKYYQHLMEREDIFIRRYNYMSTDIVDQNFASQFFETSATDENQRKTIERQLRSNDIDHEEIAELIRTISQDIEDAERLQGIDYVRLNTLALFDARVIIPSDSN